MDSKMCIFKTIIVSSFLLVAVANVETPIKDAIGFPEVEENTKLINREDRTPVYLPAMCHLNELLYPGDQKDDWICDCRPGSLYHPATKTCWPAFRQGPCGDGQYLVLPRDTVIPTCFINPCMTDTLVMWNGKCEKLGSITPCGPTFPADVLWVNAENAALECVSLTQVEYIPGISRTPPTKCLPGCKRVVEQEMQSENATTKVPS